MALLAVAFVLSQVHPLTRAHAHNDYAQARPLMGALELGFCSIEADVYLVDGKLLVGHNRGDLKPERTLDSMYLRPLAAAVTAHHGHVYSEPAEVILLVDIKSDGPGVYGELKREIRPYQSWLTHYRNGKVSKRAVTIILSGERPIDVLSQETERWAFIDGRPDEPSVDPKLTPLISASWEGLFKWDGKGAIADGEKTKLAGMVRVCHEHGQKLRFWATPETAAAWQMLYDTGIDLIGTDRQKDLADFLTRQTSD